MSVDTFTTGWYESLPEVHRTLDATGSLLAYLSLLGDQVGVPRQFVDDITAGTMTAPATVQARFIPFLAGMLGLPASTPRTGLDPVASGYYRHATTAAIVRAVTAVYGVLAAATVTRNWRGERWHLTVTTVRANTAASGRVIKTWRELLDSFPTFADIGAEIATYAAVRTIDAVHLDAARAASGERPNGVRLFHLFADAAPSATPLVGTATGVAGRVLIAGVAA